MPSPTPLRTLPALALLLALGACITTPEQPAPPPEEISAQARAEQERSAWLEQRNQAIRQLRQNSHLSVTERENDEAAIQIRSGALFKTASTDINPKVQPVLEHIVSTLNAHPALAVRVIGHTDNTGDPQRNQQLSAQRAESVRNALVSLGLDENRVSHEGRGDTEPIAPNTSSEGRSVNRRVDLLISAHRPLVSEQTEDDQGADKNDGSPEEP